jgi:hypothetical protein
MINRDTELGVIIHSPQIANEFVEQLGIAAITHSCL